MFFMAPAPQGIMADPNGNLCQPVLKRGIIAKSRKMFVYLDEDLLTEVIQLVGITGKTGSKSEYSPLMVSDQSRKGPIITSTRS